MSKKLLYKLPFLILVGIIIFSSCNSRQSKNDLLKKAISNYKGSIEPVEVVNYFPKEYSEVIQDSILSNGFKVTIKTFTNMNKSVTNTTNSNLINYKNHFRQIDSNVIVFKNDHLIFNETIDKTFISRFLSKTEYFDAYIGNSISIDEAATLNTNSLVLIASLYKPKSNQCVSYNIVIDENGNYSLNKLDYART